MTHDTLYKDRLSALREALLRRKVDGFLIPRADEYQGEYVPASADRMRWISGFTGSAGFVIVLKDKAGVFSDGRYTIQLRQQIDASLFETGDSTKITAGEWIVQNAPEGAVIGYDPRLHTNREIKAMEAKGAKLVALDVNPLDEVWADRPTAPAAAVEIFPMEYAGESAESKLERVAAILREGSHDAALITLPDSIAWLLNIRGADIPHIPVALSYALVRNDGTLDWFIAPERVGADVAATFGNRVVILPPDQMEKSLAAFKGQTMLVDERRSARWFTEMLAKSGVRVSDAKDPCIALKARKNDAEIAAMKAAHVRDGAAVTKFLHWFAGNGAGKTEIEIEEKLAAFRDASPLCRDSSFDTIAGFGAHGAIVHYRASAETAATLTEGNLLLLDSGAQYADGTTDITRTIAVGNPNEDMRRSFTLVLKGHIALARAKFPKGTTGAQADVFARAPLWQAGMDYVHGTGHGVGVYLSVHEESASISPRGVGALEEGMILSNEPGYYREGEYGIRIENLVLVVSAGMCAETGKEMLGFETLTLAPIDPALVDCGLLTREEAGWLQAYHKTVAETLAPYLDAAENKFLEEISRFYLSS